LAQSTAVSPRWAVQPGPPRAAVVTGSVTVVLPVLHAPETLAEAARSILTQSYRALEVMIVLNGSDAPTRGVAAGLAGEDARVRVLDLPASNLAAALNVALRAARTDLVARMDADDWCPPERLALQVAAMTERPRLAALGSAWEIEDEAGGIAAVRRPPTDPAEARWRLLIENPFAHGSMMLRRDAVLGAGGYDETFERAQDYDLWLRLSRSGEVAALPEVLYRHRLRERAGYSASALQAGHAARAMARAWAALPPADEGDVDEHLADAMSASEGPGDALAGLAGEMTARGPTRTHLLAWAWINAFIPTMPRRALEACRESRVREVSRGLVGEGVWGVHLWGAGAHTARVLGPLTGAGVRVLGLVDDAAAGAKVHGFVIASPDVLRAGDHALLSSDGYEDRLWEASESARARGVHVHRLYG